MPARAILLEPTQPPTLSARVAALTKLADDAACQEAVEIITALAKVAARGNGFTITGPEPDVAKVIVVAAARLLANPEQVDSGAGPTWTRGGFVGWSLAELVVLNARRGTAV